MNQILFSPDAAASVQMGGLGIVFRLPGDLSNNSFAVVEHPLKPHTLAAPMHSHIHEDEYSYILEGEVTFRIGDQQLTAHPGDWIYKPRNIPHTFWNAASTPARVLEIISPAGFESYFREMSAAAASGDREKMARIREKYDLASDLSSIPALCNEYHISLNGDPDPS